MALNINDAFVAEVAIERIKDNLLAYEKFTNGAITVGTNIHSGDALSRDFFGNLGEADRRDPDLNDPKTPTRLTSVTQTSPKLFFSKLVFKTLTEIERSGRANASVDEAIGMALGDVVSRWGLNKGITSAIGGITGQGDLVAGDGTAAATVELLNDAIWKLGDVSGDVVCFVAPGLAMHQITGQQLTLGSAVQYGMVYEGTPGTLGRTIWALDHAGLVSSGVVLGLVEGGVTIDESEAVKMVSDLVTGQENLGYNFQTEGAYTVSLKGLSWNVQLGGHNPDDATLIDGANWLLVDQLKNAAGVAAKVKLT